MQDKSLNSVNAPEYYTNEPGECVNKKDKDFLALKLDAFRVILEQRKWSSHRKLRKVLPESSVNRAGTVLLSTQFPTMELRCSDSGKVTLTGYLNEEISEVVTNLTTEEYDMLRSTIKDS